jgi:hypothetical protein
MVRHARSKPLGPGPPLTEDVMSDDTYTGEAYCVKCKEKREFTGHIEEVNNRRMAKGICPVCGTKVARILGKAQ